MIMVNCPRFSGLNANEPAYDEAKGGGNMAKKKGTRSTGVLLAMAAAGEVVLMLALSAISAALVKAGILAQSSIGTAGLGANALAVFLGSLLAARKFSQKKLPLTMAACGGYLALLLLANLLFLPGMPAGALGVICPAAAAALLAALLAGRRPKRRYRR